MRSRLKEYMAGERLVLPTVYPVPDGLCDTLRHIGAEEGVVDVHVEVEWEGCVFRHGLKDKGKKKPPPTAEAFSFQPYK